jgi:hypothetical protein
MARLVAVTDEKPKAAKLILVDEQKKEPSLSEKLGRQAGLTGRYIAEAGAGIGDILASPIRFGANLFLPENAQLRPVSSVLAESNILPKPENATERVVGDISRNIAATGMTMGLAGLSQPISTAGQAVKTALTSSPTQQVASAVGAGGAGGLTREAGGGQFAQISASLLGGLGSPYALNAATKPVKSLTELVANQKINPVQIDIRIESALKPSGVKLSDLPSDVAQSLRNDVTQALKSNNKLDVKSTKALVDYRLTGATPTEGTLTLNPSIITREKNLAKQGANSQDPNAQRLATLQNENNQVLLQKLNKLGAESAQDTYTAGQSVAGRLKAFGETNKQQIGDLYTTAKDSSGRVAELDGFTFTDTVGKNLNKELKTAFLPQEFKTFLNDISTGKLPLTVDVAEQLKTTLATAQRGTMDGNVKSALGIVRDGIENAPLRANQNLGREAIDAFNAARKANAQYMSLQKSTPALKAAMEDMAPDQFFNKFVVRAPANEFKNTLSLLPEEGKREIKNNVIAYIKNSATNNNPDEVARLSADAMNKALIQIGEPKLKLLFSADELAQIKAIQNVAKREQFLPVGSAVNTSNSASTLIANLMERLAGSTLASKIPLGGALVNEPARNISIGINSNRALSVPRAITQNQAPQSQSIMQMPASSLLSGLLNQEE